MGKVKSIHENQYIISDNSAHHLLDLGFKYDNEEDKAVLNEFSKLNITKK